ncbi:MAG: 30S ribosomal protein S18 [Candidatus Anoxychlamydiales bacterium]|nr:30S ribosomal protein S18 [Candidatus Anoxychlamydiales bacterium]
MEKERTRKRPFSFGIKRKKVCPFQASKIKKIDYKDIENLRFFVTERGKILPRRITGVSFYFQKQLKKAIKRARHMAFLPFVSEE